VWCVCVVQKKRERKISYPPLGELAGTLVLSDPQQLENTLLVGGKAADLTHQVTDELDTLGNDLRRKNTD